MIDTAVENANLAKQLEDKSAKIERDLRELRNSLTESTRSWGEYMSFMAERVEGPGPEQWMRKNKKKYVSKRRKEAAGKVLNYKRADPAVQEGIRQAREAEWTKWKQFNSGQNFGGQLACQTH